MAHIREYIHASFANCTKGRGGASISHIVTHYTGTNASAHNNLVYFSRPGAKCSAHYFVDTDGGIYQSVAEENTAWHAGNWAVNTHSIGIEVVSAGSDFTEAQIEALRVLVGELKAKYQIPDANVIRHFDVTGKRCPAPYVDNGKWQALKARILGGGAYAPAPQAPAPTQSIAELAAAVLRGEYGNGEERKRRLGANYAAVQAEVNRILGAKSAPAPQKPDIEALANAVIRGEYGNGETRKQKLGVWYHEVQARVNQKLGY